MARWFLPALHVVVVLLTAVALIMALLGRRAEQDLLSGLAHPLLDLDHFLALIAAGLWAGRLPVPALWAIPLSFLTGMALGFPLAAPGAVAAVEPLLQLAMGMAAVVLAAVAQLGLRPVLQEAAVALVLLGICHGVTDRVEAGVAAAGPFTTGNLATATALLALGVLTGLASRPAD